MKYISLYLMVLAALLSGSGCATVTSGTTQTITIETSPPGATCKLAREGETIGAVNPTPGSVTVGKDKDAIDISCDRDGFLSTSQTMTSSFEGWTLGNALIGGIIGIAIDAGSGAMNEYPSSIQITLVPENFASAGERDLYFDGLVTDLNGKFDEIAQGKRYACSLDSCRKKLEKLNAERDVQLARIEGMRSAAVVDGACAEAAGTC